MGFNASLIKNIYMDTYAIKHKNIIITYKYCEN